MGSLSSLGLSAKKSMQKALLLLQIYIITVRKIFGLVDISYDKLTEPITFILPIGVIGSDSDDLASRVDLIVVCTGNDDGLS